MTHRIAALVVGMALAPVALSAGGITSQSRPTPADRGWPAHSGESRGYVGRGWLSNPGEHLADGIEIIVNGSPRTRYAHDGRWYVEAVKSREYAIRVHNPYGVRVAVALSVDGLNTIDARRTTAADARKWVLEPYQTVTISGWQTSRTEARRFEFTSEEKSYGQALGQTDDLGLITAVYFKERVADPPRDRERGSTSDRSMPMPSAPRSPAAAPAAEASGNGAGKAARDSTRDELAATGMGRSTEHVVTQVRLDLEPVAARTVNVRYEFGSQLVRLGILPAARSRDGLHRREHAEGFEGGFSPVPRGW